MTPLHLVAGLTVIAGLASRNRSRQRSSVGAAPVVTTKQRINYYQKNYAALNGQFPTSGQSSREMRATLQARQFWWAYLQEGATSQEAVDKAMKVYKERRGNDPRVETAFRTLAHIDDWILQAK